MSQPQSACQPTCVEDDAGGLDLLIGRRESTRHPVDMTGRFITRDRNVRVQIDDISATGASIRIIDRRALPPGRLCWLGFETFAEVLWHRGDRCGLRFAEPLTAACLRETLEFADKIAHENGARYRRLAAAWTHGPGDY